MSFSSLFLPFFPKHFYNNGKLIRTPDCPFVVSFPNFSLKIINYIFDSYLPFKPYRGSCILFKMQKRVAQGPDSATIIQKYKNTENRKHFHHVFFVLFFYIYISFDLFLGITFFFPILRGYD